MAEENPTPEASRGEPLSALWRIIAAPQTLLVLLGAIALVLALGALVPQLPPQAVRDPQAWLAVQPGFFGQQNGLVRALGLYDLYHAFWFRLLLALTGLTLFVWIVDAVDLAWRAAGRQGWTADSFAFWGDHAPQVRLPSSLSPQDTYARLGDFLSGRGYRWADVPDLPVPSLVAGRRAFALWARPAAYGALALALLGLAVVGQWGWRNEDWQPVVGESRAVGRGNPYTIRLDAFELQPEGGSLRDAYSQISWLADDAVVRQSTVRLGRPATLQGVAVRQVGYVPAVRVRGRDKAGRPLTLQVGGELGTAGEVEIVFASPQAQPVILAPDQDLFLVLTFEPRCAEGRPALRLTRLHSGSTESQAGGVEPQPVGVLYESGSLAVEGLRLAVDLSYAPILRVDYRPAMGLVVGSMALAVVAMAVGWLVPPRLLWAAIGTDPEGATLLRLLALPGARGSRWFSQLADRLREALADDA